MNSMYAYTGPSTVRASQSDTQSVGHLDLDMGTCEMMTIIYINMSRTQRDWIIRSVFVSCTLEFTRPHRPPRSLLRVWQVTDSLVVRVCEVERVGIY